MQISPIYFFQSRSCCLLSPLPLLDKCEARIGNLRPPIAIDSTIYYSQLRRLSAPFQHLRVCLQVSHCVTNTLLNGDLRLPAEPFEFGGIEMHER